MSWDDLDYGQEFAKFREANIDDDVLSTENTEVMYIQVLWDTIEKTKNMWNKNRMRVRVNPIRLCRRTPYSSDEVIEQPNLYLDMGARLYNELKKLADKKPKYVKIIRDLNPRDKFDTWYKATPYKLVIQEKSSNQKKSK